ncbi:UNVERIFIED_CONTAM: hypothetical protein GTU68_064912 [Idotea baltica]|nr:hypothetical protein [Idotea baltica]
MCRSSKVTAFTSFATAQCRNLARGDNRPTSLPKTSSHTIC